MTRKHHLVKPVSNRDGRKSADDSPPPISKPMPPGLVRQSPLSEGVEVQAQRLIHEAGSPAAAKTAVDVAAERENAPDFQEDHFALRWGFASRADMRAASKPLTGSDGQNWWATALPNKRWVVWNREDLAAAETYDSLEEARQSVNRSAS
jgi:hypothetical protein